MLKNNQNALSMEFLRTKSEYSGTDVKPVKLGSYERGNNGAWKICHGIPHNSAKGDGNKGGIYISTYAPG